jgi:predicted MFS family arabinose efflux permease
VLVAALALPLTRLTRGLPRKPLLVATIAAYGLSSLVVAVAPGFWAVAAGRTIGGAAHALFFSVVSVYAARLVPPRAVGRAVAITFVGTSLGYVLGVPAATFVGDAVGWRAAFGGLAAVAGVLAVAMLVVLPAVPGSPDRPARGRRAGPAVRVIGLVNVTLFLGHYACYTYISTALIGAGLATDRVAAALLVLGAAGILGVALAARSADRRPRAGLLVALGAMAVGTVGLLVLHPAALAAVALATLWCAGFGAVPSFFMTAALRAPGGRPEEVGAVVNATSNVGIAGGALLGAGALHLVGAGGLPAPTFVLVVVTAGIVLLSPAAFPRAPAIRTLEVGGPDGQELAPR